MWNETGTFRAEFSRKIRNRPRFKIRWNLFRFLNSYGMFRPFLAKRNGIDNLGYSIIKATMTKDKWKPRSLEENYGLGQVMVCVWVFQNSKLVKIIDWGQVIQFQIIMMVIMFLITISWVRIMKNRHHPNSN